MNKARADRIFAGKRILITGGTGSLGKVLLRRILDRELDLPQKILLFSRDEGKQHQLRIQYQEKGSPTDEIIYANASRLIEFRIGDVRDYSTVCGALRDIDFVFNAAALKQVPTCEYCPLEAIQTNLKGAENIVMAIRDLRLPVETVVGISTDKAVKPVNVMGMTKALQERIFTTANLYVPETRFIVVRYGNVLASRGSVIPLFHHQISIGGPVTITHKAMTRFLISLDDAVSTIFAALTGAHPGEIYVPRIPSGKVWDIAEALIDGRPLKIDLIGTRPGEKLHETLISEEESHYAVERGRYYAIAPLLPELRGARPSERALAKEYSSADDLMTSDEVRQLLIKNDLMVRGHPVDHQEFVR